VYEPGRCRSPFPGREGCRGEVQLSTILAHSTEALGNPFVAVLLGLVLAFGLFFTSRASFRLVTPRSGGSGVVLAASSLFARLLFVTIALWAYKNASPFGIKPFALSVAGGFVVMYTVELVRTAGLHRFRRPVAARH
jgi:predicted transporter